MLIIICIMLYYMLSFAVNFDRANVVKTIGGGSGLVNMN